MSDSKTPLSGRPDRSLEQYLVSLYWSGITHLPKPRPVPPEEAAAGAEETTAESAPARPSPKPESPTKEKQVAASKPQKAAGAEPPGSADDGRQQALTQLAAEVAQCARCPELVANRTQTVFGVGNPHADLLFLGEAPGADEDRQGIPFVGRAGKLLTDIITKGMGLRREDVYICNILRCRPPGNRNPTDIEASNCRPWLDAQLAIIQPKFICCLGLVAARHLLGMQSSLSRLRGTVQQYEEAQVICTYHPAYLLRNPAAKKATWEDIQLLMSLMGLPVPNQK